MKTIVKVFLTAFAGLFILASCDKIEPPYTEGGNTPPPDTGTTVIKTVLIEDYTGHTCPNCPGAAVVAHNLKNSYGADRVIVISVHAGPFAAPRPGTIYTIDLQSEAGTEWDSYFGVSSAGNPNGLIDRITFPEGMIISETAWPSKVAEELDKEPQVSLNINNHYNINTRSLTTTVTGTFLDALEGDYFLQVCITEDSIVDYQKNSDPEVGSTPYIKDYVFMDVLRGAVNSTWGEKINENGSVTKDDSFEKSYTYTLNADWKAQHCHVVAFVYLDADKSILQTAEQDVVSE